jgi:F0F1-type ATP synthase assembly protein I
MRKVLLRLLAIQGAVTLAIAIGFYIGFASPLAAGSVLYGGAMAAITSLLLAWRVARASRPDAHPAGLYLSLLERMIFVAAAFVLAIVVLRLIPLALIAGFMGAYLAYYMAAGMLRHRA